MLKFKEIRAKKRDLNDLEERMLLDKLQDAEQTFSGTNTPTTVNYSKTKMPLSKYKDVRDLQLEVSIVMLFCFMITVLFSFTEHNVLQITTECNVHCFQKRECLKVVI